MRRFPRTPLALAAAVLLAGCIEFEDGGLLQASPTATARATSVAWGDVADRGVADPIVVTGDGTVARLTSCGTGCWQRQEVVALGSAGRSIAVGDLDGDGVDDVVVSSAAGTTAYFGGAAGAGRAAGLTAADSATVDTTVAGGSVELGDVDGDGDLDVVVMGESNDPFWPVPTLAEVKGNGAGGFAAATVVTEYASSGAAYTAPALGDVDGDGNDEILQVNGHAAVTNWTLVTWHREPGGTWSTTTVDMTASIATGDLNGDGRDDVALRTPGISGFTARITVRCSTGIGYQACGTGPDHAFLDTGSIAWTGPVEIADVDGDGKADLLTVSSDLDRLSAWRGIGNGGFFRYDGGARLDTAVAGANGPFAVAPTGPLADVLVALDADNAGVRHLDNVSTIP